ncbi:transposase [Geoglobus ahangari]|uniref:Transposase n=1 Tax=Geoglobus ahangari TaxID=113653 RepID=A0A0F7IGF0_9EURY|nr:zinc ribbon domain-containing protein [Geoglobus ahangari]AKG92328.1 transposase [Geoglobus ahangari]
MSGRGRSSGENYRAITLRLEPTKKQKRLLERNLQTVVKMLEISRYEFQKQIYHKFKEEQFDVSSRLLDLMVQRISKSLMSNKVLPLDERNYKFVNPSGRGWFIEVLLRSAKGRSRKEAKELIPICRTDNKYYSDIIDGTAYPAVIYQQGDDYFLTVTIPVEKRWEDERPVVVIGIDLNQRKHAASLYNPETGRFEWNTFFDLEPVDRKIKEIQRKISQIQRGRKPTELTEEEREQINKLYERIRKVIDKGHGDFIRKLLEVADAYWEKGYDVVFAVEELKGITKRAGKDYAPFNRWLHSQWCYRRFGILLDSRQYEVVEVSPAYTSKLCHRCGSEVKIHGKHKRLITCPSCGLKDFSRDLNSARNIAIKAYKEFYAKRAKDAGNVEMEADAGIAG